MEKGEVKRQPVNFKWQFLNMSFLRRMAEVCVHAEEKYGSTDQYCDGPLHGEKSPVNHAFNHLALYVEGVPHDWLGDVEDHLPAAAYNLMMEWFYRKAGIHEPQNKVNSLKAIAKKLIAKPRNRAA